MLNFNSIKVRLKLRSLAVIQKYVNLFQFHKGTIKTNTYNIRRKAWTNFNSIKVRLKHRCLEG